MTKLLFEWQDDIIYIKLQCFNKLTFLPNSETAVLFWMIFFGENTIKLVFEQLREVDTL